MRKGDSSPIFPNTMLIQRPAAFTATLFLITLPEYETTSPCFGPGPFLCRPLQL